MYPSYGQSFNMDKVLFESKTEHQHLVIFENEQFGRVMALDGIIQTTEKDEFIYHEMLTHVPLLAHQNPKKVLIIGGGDGGILRETLKHQQLEKIVQVEIDRAVIDMCKEYFPNHSQGAFDDPRATIVIDDGIHFVRECQEKFDIIISDSTDPIGPGEVLFTNDFYRLAKNCLNEGGIMVAQNGVVMMQPDEVVNTRLRMGQYFAEQSFYTVAVPTYVGGAMTLAWGTDEPQHRQTDLETVRQRYVASGIKTRYYNPEMHTAAFALPQYVIELLKKTS
nr:polyamine aminopropyltransferase [Pleionea sp. CnH1-48]